VDDKAILKYIITNTPITLPPTHLIFYCQTNSSILLPSFQWHSIFSWNQIISSLSSTKFEIYHPTYFFFISFHISFSHSFCFISHPPCWIFITHSSTIFNVHFLKLVTPHCKSYWGYVLAQLQSKVCLMLNLIVIWWC